MNRTAVFFLVLLRLAIGWHFFTEGVQKLQSVEIGETTTNKPFSSAAYFREAPGPGGSWMRSTLGDPDVEAVALLTVEVPAGDLASLPPHRSMPPELRKRWEKLLADYASHYKLSDEQQERAKVLLDQAGDGVVQWLTSTTKDDNSPELKRKFPSGEVKRQIAPAELIEDYKTRLAEVKQISDRKLWDFGRDVEKADLRQKKADVAARRTLLMTELDRHTLAFMRSLNVLVAEPLTTGLVLDLIDLTRFTTDDVVKQAKADAAYKPSRWFPWAEDDRYWKEVKQDRLKALEDVAGTMKAISDATKPLEPATADMLGSQTVTPIAPKKLRETLKEQSAALTEQASRLKGAAHGDRRATELAGSVEELASELGAEAERLSDHEALSVETKGNRLLDRMDLLTRWGLTVVGFCLMIGCLSRTNAWLAAGFLLMTYLAVPPWPWLPSAGPSEGNYLFVNKNLIEMLALCVLGVTSSGRAFGVDTVIHWIWTSLTKKK